LHVVVEVSGLSDAAASDMVSKTTSLLQYMVDPQVSVDVKTSGLTTEEYARAKESLDI
jgi:hypothetical protein